ncbi:MAG TPA: hypothetical protein VK726_09755 [Acetobacteraceae bacterium]|jgi:uncharacterized membrane protein (GlpM family)|nr:hypothetical protein [Acetobacteraceae bacterium]
MTFWLPLLLRAITSALIVVLASVIAEAAGPFWGGLIISLPIAAGPAYVMLSLQHDAAFIADGALSSLAANAATFVLLTAIALLAPHYRRPTVMTGALAAWFASLLLIHQVAWTVPGAVLLNLALIVPAYVLTRTAARTPPVAAGPLRRRWYELPMRAALVGGVVAIVVTTSRALGPTVTGMAAVFPVAFTSFAFLILPRLGGPTSAAVMASAIRAMPGFALSLLVLHLCAETLGVWAALAAMLLTSLLWSAGMMAVRASRVFTVSRAPRMTGSDTGTIPR